LVLLGDTIDEADCKTWTDNGGGLIFGFWNKNMTHSIIELDIRTIVRMILNSLLIEAY
jgi:hypothetical protein